MISAKGGSLRGDKLGMTDLRDDADRVMKQNFPNSRFYAEGLERKKAWWKLW